MFNYMRIKFGSKTIICRKTDGEELLNILHRTVTTEYAGSTVHPTTDDLAIELIREMDLKPNEREVLGLVTTVVLATIKEISHGTSDL